MSKYIPLVVRIRISLVVFSGVTAAILITEACEANPTHHLYNAFIVIHIYYGELI